LPGPGAVAKLHFDGAVARTLALERDIVRRKKSLEDHKFNDDLLMNEEEDRGKTDLEWAREMFPTVIHVLDHPRLRAKFAEYEEKANRGRDWVFRLGSAAVISVTAELMVITTGPVWPQAPATRTLGFVVEVLGILAALVSVGGLWHGKWKHLWLESRLMTERLRQWHFQFLVRQGALVETSCESEQGLQEFDRQREIAFDNFLSKHERHLDVELQLLTEEPDYGVWLHSRSTSYTDSKTILEEVFKAYRALRIDHQTGYAVYKLLTSTRKPISDFLKWPPLCQKAVLAGAATFCFVAALICSAGLGYCNLVHVNAEVELGIGLVAICIAIIGASLRAVQDGLALEKTIERYKDYRSRLFQISDRFHQAVDARERLHLMEDLEIASVDEMKGFLRAHYGARFLV
jgi:hypothetical protein